MSSYPHLLSPLRIGSVTVRNRIMQTAHVKLFARDGVDSERNVAYQIERARGGAALLITGNRLVHPTSTTGMPRFAFAYLSEAMRVDRRMTAGVHEHGAAIFAQLNHFGVNAASDVADDLRVLWAPSAVKSPAYGETAKAMELEDIAEVVEWWARCAELSREAGFDGTEVHLSHSYLLHQFLSPIYNKRTDQYGGSLENRLRFPREVIAAIRQRTGRDWVVGIRVSLSDFIPGALDVSDAIAIASALEGDGEIDYVNVTAAGYHNIHLAIQPSDGEDGFLVDLTASLKQGVGGIPVFTVGGIKDPHLAEEVIAAGKADMVAMTRAQIADPEFAKKLLEGREGEIVHCIRGNQGCIARVFKGLPIQCTVNPAAGRERRFGAGTLQRAEEPRYFVVAGGGPAGMKAACVLAERGHRVTLLEREERLGGQINLITRTPGREEFRWIARDLEGELRRRNVDMRLATEGNEESVSSLSPDAVIVATGALPSRSGFSIMNPLVDELPGVHRENVVSAWDVLRDSRPIGERVLILDDDGGRYTAGVAEVLIDQGKRVMVATHFNALFPATFYTLDMPFLYQRLFEKGLSYRLNVWTSAIESESVSLFNIYTGAEEETVGVDTVVLATGPRADESLYFALKGRVDDLHRIGDCVAPRKLDHAIYEGFLAGRELWSPDERYIYEGQLERMEEMALA
ncbi:MAG: FAD-dependent oxidoreductase [Solirubrobacterales bacterium]|nr:FAD-dependent oxidoreductase [Solirubrobacterales bacterium]